MPKHARKKQLSHTRPVTARKPHAPSSKHTRRTISTHHTLLKRLHALQSSPSPDTSAIAELQKQLEDNGGLKAYQSASRVGQSKERGGDASAVLVEWLKAGPDPGQGLGEPVVNESTCTDSSMKLLRLLDVGALSTKNASSTSGLFSTIERIDLNGSDGVQKQDLMERPLPVSEDDRFEVVSLSLVVNYVPDAMGRGEMLKRAIKFLSVGGSDTKGRAQLPAIFLVLPAPCVTNSRYFDEERLTSIMTNLGCVLIKRKMTARLVYYLFQYQHLKNRKHPDFGKKEIRSGANRNNFVITLKGT